MVTWAQGTFQSAASGNRRTAGTWTLISGTDADGVPDADDDVIIQSGHTITMHDNPLYRLQASEARADEFLVKSSLKPKLLATLSSYAREIAA